MVASGKSGDAALDTLQSVGKEKEAASAKIRMMVREYMKDANSSVGTQLMGMTERSGGGALLTGIGSMFGVKESDAYMNLLNNMVKEQDRNTQAYKDLVKAIKELAGTANSAATPNGQEVD
jgi:hypothetical protein